MLLPEDEVVSGVQGHRIEFELAIVDESLKAVDTTAYDQFQICIKADTPLVVSEVAGVVNGSIMTKVGSAECGVFKVVINPADSLLLDAKDRQDIEFSMSQSGDATQIVGAIFKDRLEIKKSNCA